jgi:hypothetical protein
MALRDTAGPAPLPAHPLLVSEISLLHPPLRAANHNAAAPQVNSFHSQSPSVSHGASAGTSTAAKDPSVSRRPARVDSAA